MLCFLPTNVTKEHEENLAISADFAVRKLSRRSEQIKVTGLVVHETPVVSDTFPCDMHHCFDVHHVAESHPYVWCAALTSYLVGGTHEQPG